MNVADKTLFDSFLERNGTFLDRAFVYARVEFAQFLVELAFDVAKGKKPHTTFVIIIFLFKTRRRSEIKCAFSRLVLPKDFRVNLNKGIPCVRIDRF